MLLLAATLSGCSTYNGVYSTGPDTYSMSGSNKGVFAGQDVMEHLYKEASTFCANQGKKFVTQQAIAKNGSLINRSTAKLDFKCVAHQ